MTELGRHCARDGRWRRAAEWGTGGQRRDRRPRLRRSVQPADRAPHPRLRGVQRAAAAQRAAGGGGQAQAPRDRALGRARVGVCAGRAEARSGTAGAGSAGDGHLLRDAAARARARRTSGAGGGGGVRTLGPEGYRARAAARGDAEGADVLDVSSRHRVRAPAGVHGAGLLERLAGGRRGGHDAGDIRNPVSSRGRAHALRAGDTDAVPDRHRRVRAHVVGAVDRRGSDRAHQGAGRGGQGHLRAVGRRGLLGGRAARAPRRRRSADVRVRRSRADAQGRGRAGGERVPGHVQGAAGGGRRGGALPGEAARRERARGQAQGDRRGVHQGVRGGGRRRSRCRTRPSFSCRERCTRT